jgi:NDP-sugar pyrophosphorylase family protein
VVSGNEVVSNFEAKAAGDNTWINGGFFVMEPKILII